MRTVKDKKGQVLAVILDIDDYCSHGSKFFSETFESLQVGCLFFAKNSKVQAHIHKKKEVGTAYPIVEMIMILSGTADLEIYDEEKNLIETKQVRTGNIILLKRGGHGYKFLSSVRMLDVRCGPYVDKKTDKEMI